MTLRVRFALWVAALLLAALAVFGAFVYFSLAHGLANAVDDSLRLSASQVAATVNTEDGQINFADNLPESSNVAEELRGRGLTIRLLDPAGHVVQSFGPYRALPPDAASLAAGRQGQTAFATVAASAQGEPVRFYTAPIIENGQLVGIVQVAQSLGDAEDTLHRLLAALLIGGPFLALLAALGSYFLAARALAPIDQITRAARRISAEDLSRRLNLPATNDEVGRLAATFDEMLGRLDEAFRRERQFTADASHELRTPLAAMQAILSVTRAQRRSPEDYETALADLADEADRLRGLVEDLLQLARGEGASVAARAPVDLSTLLADITDSLRPLAEAKGLALICDVPPGLHLLGDGDALIRLFVNLLDNAVKYTERGRIVVSGRAAADGLRVTVADTGIGIPVEHLPHIFDRFYRVDQARTAGGAGLGLAIALEVARRHGGTIAVDSAPGVGTTFTVYLPTHEKTRGLAS
ncbi:MAG: sensor histidine kinase [Anaerolineae bacterium]